MARKDQVSFAGPHKQLTANQLIAAIALHNHDFSRTCACSRAPPSLGVGPIGPATGDTQMAQAVDSKRRGRNRPGLGKDELLRAYHDMLLIRRFEEKAGQLYGMGLIGGFCHLYIGQEAVVVGVQMALSPGDEVITSYRDHGHMLATGM